ncbi:hypothetical protein GGU10DRAFT_335695 [Lentinula aff. detonsa]|uniref:Uncharacterized protein n=1 Tax=Lentinula aff. detonsa TaxID=2804958 RepID=A0AA38NHY1_9AGAR|nr:hypothetical protein GGU10DRAFT_335695 [Lentinula aff. detonsa]
MPSLTEQLASARQKDQQISASASPAPTNFQREPLGNSEQLNQLTPCPRSSLFSDGPHDGTFGLGSSGLVPTLDHASSPINPIPFPTWSSEGNNLISGLANDQSHDFDSQSQGNPFHLPGSQVVNMDLSPSFAAQLKSSANDLPLEMKEGLEQYIQQLIREKDTHWAVSGSLKKLIAKYAKAYMLSSTAKFYIKCNPEDIIVSALRANRVKDLPNEDDLTATDTLKSAVSRAVVQSRSTVKDHIMSTVRDTSKTSQLPADERDLGTVAQSLLGGLKDVPLSLALMYRLALMRNVADNNPDMNTRDFWPTVDSEMAALLGVSQEGIKTQQQVIADFQLTYELDVKKYGKHRVSPTNIGSSTYQWKTFVKTVNTLAGNATIIDSTEKKAERKRKRRINDTDARRTRSSAAADEGSDGEEDTTEDGVPGASGDNENEEEE